jgi:hypothetical protein
MGQRSVSAVETLRVSATEISPWLRGRGSRKGSNGLYPELPDFRAIARPLSVRRVERDPFRDPLSTSLVP